MMGSIFRGKEPYSCWTMFVENRNDALNKVLRSEGKEANTNGKRLIRTRNFEKFSAF
jgi:hypothetical protein